MIPSILDSPKHLTLVCFRLPTDMKILHKHSSIHTPVISTYLNINLTLNMLYPFSQQSLRHILFIISTYILHFCPLQISIS